MTRSVVLSLDIGTSSCKGALYSDDGKRLDLKSSSYSVHYPAANCVEQEPQDYLDSALEVVGELMKAVEELGYSIASIGLTTQTPTLICCEDSGAVIGRAIFFGSLELEVGRQL